MEANFIPFGAILRHFQVHQSELVTLNNEKRRVVVRRLWYLSTASCLGLCSLSTKLHSCIIEANLPFSARIDPEPGLVFQD